jgi:hypothetical protein
MCDVPSIVVFCSESFVCFPGTASKFFLKLLVIIPVAPTIIGVIVVIIIIIIIVVVERRVATQLLFRSRYLSVIFVVETRTYSFSVLSRSSGLCEITGNDRILQRSV